MEKITLKTCWSIQDKQAWAHALKVGYLEGNPDYICIEDFYDSYEWMKKQMRKRLPSYNDEQPIWLWLKKPDMRYAAHAERGTEIVRLTIELPEETVLVSDFDKWHIVLSEHFCSDTEEEDDLFEQEKLEISKEESWERIFDLTRPRDPEWWGKEENAVYQAVTGRIYLDSIKKVEHFIAR
ncbi:DUF3841 domain-containing protein [Metabacillus fastidiosus]|uniref:DUF3841 domain-containing protein n=1 Tax=Metabacillus fastidiosus TaxID=1458 RepID=A0ABU6P4Y1_9BACI|nr:DUF3841 domain-containing protein [Metabacillus fastidiosus]